MRKQTVEIGMAVLLLISVYALSGKTARMTANAKTAETIVVIDAGHGGADPGKVAADGCKEKDINLAVARKVQGKLEKAGIEVVMTREKDEMLHDAGNDGEKVRDMQLRCEKINTSQAVCAVSIHQNSFQSSSVRGAQVFYYTGSEQGQQFAQIMQQQLVEILDPSNTRVCKENSSYYLLKKTSVPLVIVECGFLSNPEEAAMLQTEEFQDRTADAICMGIQKYLETCSDQTGSPEISGKAEQRVLEKY